MYCYRNLMCLLMFTMGMSFIEARTYKKLTVKESLVVCGNMKVCGTINCVHVGPLAYGSFINVTNNTTVVAIGAPIPFTDDTVPPFAIVHGGSPFSSVTVEQTGTYLAWYKIRIAGLVPTAVQMYRNGTPITGTDDAGFTATIDGVLISLEAGDVITLVNIGSAPITLASFGNSPPASFVLLRIT